MKVGIDLTSLLYQRGVSRYTRNLTLALTGLPEVTVFGFASSGRGRSILKKELTQLPLKKFHLGFLPPSLRRVFWHDLHLLPVKNQLPEIEVFHSWDYLQPPDRKIPLVSTIHDLAMLEFPEVADPTILKHHQQSWHELKKRGSHVIAVSEHTKQDLIKKLDFDPAKVHVVYEALPTEALFDPNTFPQPPVERPFFLFVGTREPRKNLNRLIEAWLPLSDKYDLVLAGKSGWGELSHTSPHLKIIDNVSDRQLAELYHRALGLAYPSLNEGFGLPILEAFYYQTPVVTSRGTATEEVAGAAGILVDPLDVQSIYAGLKQLSDENPAQRAARAQLMTDQLAKFSWARAAAETLAVYQQAIKDFHA